jgi:hypothetical protein
MTMNSVIVFAVPVADFAKGCVNIESPVRVSSTQLRRFPRRQLEPVTMNVIKEPWMDFLC